MKTMAYLTFFNILFTTLRCVVNVTTALMASRSMFSKLNDKIVYAKMKFFDKTPVGRIVNRISKDVLSVDDEVPSACGSYFEYMGNTAGLLVGIMIQLPYTIIVLFVAGWLIVKGQRKYRGLLREVTRLNANNTSKILGHITETASGIILIRAFKKETKFIRDFFMKMRDKMGSEQIVAALNQWSHIRLRATSLIIYSSVSLSIFLVLRLNLTENYSLLALALTYVLMLTPALSDTTYYFGTYEKAFVSVERIRHYFDNETENLTKKEYGVGSDYKPLMIEVNSSIVFDGVRLTYCKKDDPTPRYALNGVSFSIKKGEKVAICGRTGSGKTSIMNALFRLYDISEGTVYVGGKNIAHLSLSELRSSMAVIPQFGFLFNSSLKDNLDPSGTKSDDEIRRIINESGFKLRGVNLKKDEEDTKGEDDAEELKELGTNIMYEIERSGKNLSNGEKQIINFLRILLQNVDIICLDEATSNMDPKTDKALHRALFEYTREKNLLVITHRLENIDHYDRVIAMENGVIVEEGKFEELRRNAGVFFGTFKNKEEKQSYVNVVKKLLYFA
eukprot:TRINITY_DN5274_c0_g1_i15.p1 TRINITY_DN5274_c0_g1~~TRINITY_DN5274_c0_g1_i15.p1  ORF type:complete len:561 (+),score=74.00 TRINITY_DN5274_c0_g1_i15:325-2007(+)